MIDKLNQPVPNPAPAQPPVDPTKKPMPLILKLMIGCGGLVSVTILLLLLIILENYFFQPNPERNKEDINEAAIVIKKCIISERSKGIADQEIYSSFKCSNKEFLIQNNYTDEDLIGVFLSTNHPNTKICAVNFEKNMLFTNGVKKYITSWDSETDVITEVGQGKQYCD